MGWSGIPRGASCAAVGTGEDNGPGRVRGRAIAAAGLQAPDGDDRAGQGERRGQSIRRAADGQSCVPRIEKASADRHGNPSQQGSGVAAKIDRQSRRAILAPIDQNRQQPGPGDGHDDGQQRQIPNLVCVEQKKAGDAQQNQQRRDHACGNQDSVGRQHEMAELE